MHSMDFSTHTLTPAGTGVGRTGGPGVKSMKRILADLSGRVPASADASAS